MVMQGFSFQEMLNPIKLAGEFANMRYSAEVKPNIFSQAGLQGSYITVVLGGLYYGSLKPSSKQKGLVVILSFLPSLLAMTLQSAKGLFFFSIFVFYAGILVTGIFNKKYKLLTVDTIKKFSFFAIFAFPLLISSFLARGLQDAPTHIIVDRLRFYLITYSSGHLFAFSDWFSERYFDLASIQYKQEDYTVGFYTFMGFFRIAGDEREIPMGTYDEFFEHGLYVKTNIYTIFRGAITDFTLIGSLIFALFCGYVVNFIYYRLLIETHSVFKIVFFIYFVGIAYQSYLISSLMWVTVPFVFSVTLLILFSVKVLNNSMRSAR